MTTEPFLFSCKRCDRPAFLVYGLCDTCAPQSHTAFEENRAHWDGISKAFKAFSNNEPLVDWDTFEAWLDAQGIPKGDESDPLGLKR